MPVEVCPGLGQGQGLWPRSHSGRTTRTSSPARSSCEMFPLHDGQEGQTLAFGSSNGLGTPIPGQALCCLHLVAGPQGKGTGPREQREARWVRLPPGTHRRQPGTSPGASTVRNSVPQLISLCWEPALSVMKMLTSLAPRVLASDAQTRVTGEGGLVQG